MRLRSPADRVEGELTFAPRRRTALLVLLLALLAWGLLVGPMIVVMWLTNT